MEIDQTTDLDQMPESLSKLDCELFQQAVWSSKGKLHLSADYMDEEASTMIPSGDSHRDKITRETQASVKTALRHCTRITQGVKFSKDLVDTPLSDLPFKSQNFCFFSPQNIIGLGCRIQLIIYPLHHPKDLPQEPLRRQPSIPFLLRQKR